MDDETQKIFADTLKQVNENKIEKVDLTSKKVGHENIKRLAEALKTNTSVKEVVLRGACALDSPCDADVVVLESCIGDEGTKAISQMLEVNKSITTIDLGGECRSLDWLSVTALCRRQLHR